MEEAKGVVKHVLLVKFKDDVPPEKIDEVIKAFANLLNLIEPLKNFQWSGTNVSIENLNQGYTHVFECTFESVQGVAEYIPHPAHVEFSNLFVPVIDKFVVIDYKPTFPKF